MILTESPGFVMKTHHEIQTKTGLWLGLGRPLCTQINQPQPNSRNGVLPKHISNWTAKAFKLYNHPLKKIPERTCLYVDSKIWRETGASTQNWNWASTWYTYIPMHRFRCQISLSFLILPQHPLDVDFWYTVSDLRNVVEDSLVTSPSRHLPYAWRR